MRWVKCEGELREKFKRNMNQKYDAYFENFMDSGEDVRVVEWDETDFTNYHCAYNSLHAACRKSPYPIKLVARKQTLYVVRTDM